MLSIDKPIANPMLVFRDEFDDWSILFDPDRGDSFGLNPVSAFIWKRLDGTRTIRDIYTDLLANCDDVPDTAENDIAAFVAELIKKGYAGTEWDEVFLRR